MTEDRGELAIVMTGGGARAAYQVGLLRAVARRYPDLRVPILTGVSAGAINAAHLASHTGRFDQGVEDLAALWSDLTTDRVFRITVPSAFGRAVNLALRLFSGGYWRGPQTRGLVDTRPLRRTLERTLSTADGELIGVDFNLRRGDLKAVAITTTCYSTGQTVTWVQGKQIEQWQRRNRKSSACSLHVDHVLASASLPVFFPAVKVGDRWYGDGGVRLTNPLSPAVHLGARRILTISTRYDRSSAEADIPVVKGYPPPGQIGGLLLNAIFLDHIDGDALQMERINQLLERSGPDEASGFHPVDLLVLRPSRDLGAMANEYEPHLPPTIRYMARGLGAKDARSNDLLSLIMFQPDYLQALIDLGERDAERRMSEIVDLLGVAEPAAGSAGL